MSASVPPSDQMRVAGSGRRKVALPPGRSQLDWVRNQSKLRSQRPRSITMRELRQHSSRTDAWLAISGQVYNITPYVEYHPGGVCMILAGAGKDATKLFNRYHAWVNVTFMLKNCYLGMLEDDGEAHEESDEGEEADGESSGSDINDGIETT